MNEDENEKILLNVRTMNEDVSPRLQTGIVFNHLCLTRLSNASENDCVMRTPVLGV